MILRQSKWPQPGTDWLNWAKKLVQALDLQEQASVIHLPPHSMVNLPKANKDGMMIFITDAPGGAVPAFSYQGAWLSVLDRSNIIGVALQGARLQLTAGEVEVTT